MSERKPGWYWVHREGSGGYRMVPVEPTPLMTSVAKDHIEAGHDAATIWRAMLMYVPRRESV